MKVTRDILRAMADGETKSFCLDSVAAVQTARATASQTGQLLGCRFAVESDPDNRITVTRLPR